MFQFCFRISTKILLSDVNKFYCSCLCILEIFCFQIYCSNTTNFKATVLFIYIIYTHTRVEVVSLTLSHLDITSPSLPGNSSVISLHQMCHLAIFNGNRVSHLKCRMWSLMTNTYSLLHQFIIGGTSILGLASLGWRTAILAGKEEVVFLLGKSRCQKLWSL